MKHKHFWRLSFHTIKGNNKTSTFFCSECKEFKVEDYKEKEKVEVPGIKGFDNTPTRI